MVSCRRGRNFLLHNLEENDVVFGTKGNGRNEMFLKVLEDHSEQYVHLSKFQKMALIQEIIREWKGNFYIMNAKTNDLCLAKKKDHDLSSTDPSSRKLYTSVRRMMNYVNSKVQRHPQRSKSIRAPSLVPRRSTMGTTIATSRLSGTNSIILTKKEHKLKPTKHVIVPHADTPSVAAQKKQPAVMTAIDYIRKNHVTLPLTESSFVNFRSTPTNMSISSPKRSVMLVTPEPSPRVMLQNPPPISYMAFSKPAFAQNGTELVVTSALPLTPVSSVPTTTIARTIEAKNSYFIKQQATTATINARNKKIKKHLRPADNIIGDLEESAILALTSLGAMSATM